MRTLGVFLSLRRMRKVKGIDEMDSSFCHDVVVVIANNRIAAVNVIFRPCITYTPLASMFRAKLRRTMKQLNVLEFDNNSI